MASIAEIRAKYPQYEDMSDQQLADALYKKHYSDMPRAEFDQKVGLAGDTPPGKPGSREYADWARSRALAGKELPQVSVASPEWKDPYTDLGAKAQAVGSAWLNDIPIAGPTVLDLAQKGKAALYGVPLETVQADTQRAMDANPVEAKTAGVASSIASLAPLGATALGGKLLGMTGSLPSRVVLGSTSSAAITGADTLARGGSLEEAGRNALIGGAVGGAVPAIGAGIGKLGQNMAQRAATNAAIKGAPAAADLKSAASAMFQQLDQSGVQVSGQRFGNMAIDLVRKFQKMRANVTLDPKAVAALQEIVKAADDVQRSGGGVVLSDLHTLRQIAQKSAQSAEGRDKMFSTQIINAIDDMITSLKPADMVGGADPKQASKLMFDAIGTWGRARKVGLIEEAIAAADTYKSGVENGLKLSFLKLMKSPDYAKFSEAEKAAIREVAKGTTKQNVAELFGKLGFSFGGSAAHNIIGGSVGTGALAALLTPALGPLALPAAFAATTAAGAAGRKVAEKIGAKGAERAAQVMATPNVPSLPIRALPNLPVAPAAIPLLGN